MSAAPGTGHTPGSIKRNFALDKDASRLLDHFCPKGFKTTGKFLSRLIYEFSARMDERAQLAAAPMASLADDATHALQDVPGD
jgi:hypothetical protein